MGAHTTVPNKGMPLYERTLHGFRREVTALLIVGHRFTADRALKSVVRWDRYVRARWKEGKPPCAVADHIYKWEKEGDVCPCNAAEGDCARCRRRKIRARTRSRHARDADDPRAGEIFESKSGKRWRIDNVDGGMVNVELAGVKQVGRLRWKKENLKGMRQVAGDPPRRSAATVVQTVVLDRTVFRTKAQAMTWARRQGFRATKIDVTSSSYRIRQIPPSRVRIVGSRHVSKGVLLVFGRLRRP